MIILLNHYVYSNNNIEKMSEELVALTEKIREQKELYSDVRINHLNNIMLINKIIAPHIYNYFWIKIKSYNFSNP